MSRVYETEPFGVNEQPKYLNAALEISTDFKARELLKVCLGIEKEMGRVRLVHWGPRNIDIDILLYGNSVIHTKDLVIPHPFMHIRGFVLKPLSDIAPDFVHPVFRETIRELLKKIKLKGVTEYKGIKITIQKFQKQ